ncbi:MAG TPA: VOC family protein [Acidimicrobiales bacterium]|nr:VOC family protein [Acidimicrobiales bacterium]
MRSITPNLWFDDNLEEAVDFYTSVFPDAKVHGMMHRPDGQVLTADFELAGQAVKGLNGGPEFRLTEAFSFFVECDDQAEVDHYWSVLTADGGEESQCGWLKDRFGVSWQIIPTEFLEMVSKGSPEQVERVMAAMMQMRKFDVAALRAAYEG